MASARSSPAQIAHWPATAALYAAFTAVGPEASHLSNRDRSLLLRDAVGAAVDELRPTGRTCERIVMVIKCLASEAGIDDAHAAEAIDEIEAWCVQQFYATVRRVGVMGDIHES